MAGGVQIWRGLAEQPRVPTPINANLRASDVWVGSQYATTAKRGEIATLTSVSMVPTQQGIAASMTAAGTSSVQIAASRFSILPNGGNFSIAVLRRSRDTTARASTLFGFNVSSANRVLAHAPYSDGTLYWDGGDNTAGSGRASVAFTKSTNWETLVFYAGARGREVWRNGTRLVNSTSALATLTGSSDAAVTIGNCAAVGSDSDDVALFVVAGGYDWSDSEIVAWSNDPWGRTFEPQRIWVPVAEAGGGSLTASSTEPTDGADLLTAVLIANVTASEDAAAIDISSTGTQLSGSVTEASSTAEVLAAEAQMEAALTEFAEASDIASAPTTATVSIVDLAAGLEVLGGTIASGLSAVDVWSYVMSNGQTAEANVVAIRAALEALTPAAISDYLLHNAVV